MTEYTIAVRELASFCFRRGDIDHRFSPSTTAREGVEGHRRVQARRGADYISEYPVCWREPLGGIDLVLRGRADGYDAAAGLVEEIKTCRMDPARIPAQLSQLHLAQARLYAALIARELDLPALTVRLTWLHVDQDREYPLDQHYEREELEDFLDTALARFGDWLKRLALARSARDQSLEQLDFPHASFRPGQRAIAERVYKCISGGGDLLVEAPTGIGKTAAVLYPALKALARGKHDRLVFATAKSSGRRTAEQTLSRLAAAGYRGQTLGLTARERVCLSPGSACHGDDCPYARGYYDRLAPALKAALERPSLYREDLEALAKEHGLCPYELAWDLLPWVDTVIADQHYVYSIGAGLAERLQGAGHRVTVLLDEAHNLPSRARDMYSASLARGAVLAARRQAPAGPVRRSLGTLNRQLREAEKTARWQPDHWCCLPCLPPAVQRGLQRFVVVMAETLAREPLLPGRGDGLLQLYFDALHWQRCAEQAGEEHRLELRRAGPGEPAVWQLNCLDPQRLLAQRQAQLHAVVAFSAPLSPWPWAREQLGLPSSTVCYRAPSPFQRQQLAVEVDTGIDTRFQQRRASLPDLAARLREWLVDAPGNCLLFFPSYRYLQDCLDELGDSVNDRHCWVQAPGAGEESRAELLALLAQRRDVAAFCILGGLLGEGIDLPGEQLRSVVVVGVGLPQVNRDTRARQDYFQRRYGSGFAYACQFPGMQKVSQALGRVIRDPADSGRALLLDSRYAETSYRQLLPPWWDYSERRRGE